MVPDAEGEIMIAPWWLMILEGLALIGWLCVFTNLFFKCVMGIVNLFHRPIQHVYMNVDYHPDPTRPNFMEDESAAWIRVTEKMEAIERRAQSEKKNAS
jgi:hypothetical protein